MTKIRIIIYTISILVLLIAIDGAFAKNEFHTGIVGHKHHGRTVYNGDQNYYQIIDSDVSFDSYIIHVINQKESIDKVKVDPQTFNRAKIGDSVNYIKCKGLFTDVLWSTVMGKIK